jgi:hypothetical protein
MKNSKNINAAYVTSALAWKDILKDMCNLCMKARSDLDISTACQLINFKNYKESVHDKLKQHHCNIATKTFDLKKIFKPAQFVTAENKIF